MQQLSDVCTDRVDEQSWGVVHATASLVEGAGPVPQHVDQLVGRVGAAQPRAQVLRERTRCEVALGRLGQRQRVPAQGDCRGTGGSGKAWREGREGKAAREFGAG